MNKKHLLMIMGITLMCTLFSVGRAQAIVNKEFKNNVIDVFLNDNYGAVEKYNIMLQKSEIKYDKEKEAYIYISIANIYDRNSDFENSLIYFDKAIEIYKDLNDIETLLELYSRVSEITLSAKDYKKSIGYIDNLLGLGGKVLNKEVQSYKNKDIENANMITNFYISMTNICNEFEMEDKVKWYLEKSNELINNYDLDVSEEFYYNEAEYNYNKGDYKEVLEIFNLAYEKSLKDGNIKDTYYRDREYIISAKSELALGKLDEAELSINELLELYNKNGDKLSYSKGLIIKGDIYAQREDYSKSIYYYEQSFNLAEELELNKLIKDISKRLIDSYKLEGDMEGRNKYVEKYIEMDEFLYKNNEANNIVNIIDEFQTQQSDMKLENEKYMGKYRLIMVSAIVVLLLIILIFKLRQNKNTIVEARELREALITDGLTGTYTREYIISQIEANIIEKKKFSIAMIDIDDYKKINDTYGHGFGDRVLIEMVRLIEEVIGEGNMLGRYGGEEFIVLLNEEDIEIAFDIYENIREIVQNIKLDDNRKVTISMGVKEYKVGSVENLLVEADNLLYRAKKNGKNRIEF